MNEVRKAAMQIRDGVMATNGNPVSIGDYYSDFMELVSNDECEIKLLTPAEVDEWEWETLCAQLDLDPERNAVQRIYVLYMDNAIYAHFASDEDYISDYE